MKRLIALLILTAQASSARAAPKTPPFNRAFKALMDQYPVPVARVLKRSSFWRSATKRCYQHHFFGPGSQQPYVVQGDPFSNKPYGALIAAYDQAIVRARGELKRFPEVKTQSGYLSLGYLSVRHRGDDCLSLDEARRDRAGRAVW